MAKTPKRRRSRLDTLLTEHRQLKAQHEDLCVRHEELRRTYDSLVAKVEKHREELHVQFLRIAQIQAVLDEERLADALKSGVLRFSKQLKTS